MATVAMVQGYGLTECCSTACIPDGEDLSTGRVGPPLQVAQIMFIVVSINSPRCLSKPKEALNLQSITSTQQKTVV